MRERLSSPLILSNTLKAAHHQCHLCERKVTKSSYPLSLVRLLQICPAPKIYFLEKPAHLAYNGPNYFDFVLAFHCLGLPGQSSEVCSERKGNVVLHRMAYQGLMMFTLSLW